MAKVPMLLLIGLTMAYAGEAQGQRETLDLMPTVGVLAPVRDLVVVTVQSGGASRTLTLGQDVGVLGGARITAWWSETLGWETAFAYSLSDAKLDENGTDLCQSTERSCSANVWIASSKLVARWAPVDARWTLFGGAGLTVVGHVGDFWELADAATDLGGVLSVGGAIDLSRSIALRIDVDDHIYQFSARFDDPDLGTVSLAKRWQHDLVIAATIVFHVFGT